MELTARHRSIADRPVTDTELPGESGTTPKALAALVVLGAILRFWALGANRLAFDESFNAMAGRRSLGGLFDYLRVRDSHPPLDYLLHLPLARLGADELLFRLPSAVCSTAALALFAWWMRDRGLAGVVATGLLAVSAFELVHGREARMYAEMELIGVAAAVVADIWLQRPRRWCAPAIGALVLVGLLTHVSMFLLGAGLLLVAGRRMDRAAWHWRAALASGLAGWALLWGSSFMVQTRGGHSDWIPRTTVDGVVSTVGRLVTYQAELHLVAIVLVAAGAWLLRRVDPRLARVWTCCVLVPIVVAALAGTAAPVLLDRTLTIVAWGPCLAIGVAVSALRQRSRSFGVGAMVLLAIVMLPAAVDVVITRSGPDRVLRHIEQVARPGDIIAIHPAGRLHELEWSLGVRSGEQFQIVSLPALPRTLGIERGTGPESGRVWLLDWTKHTLPVPTGPRCAQDTVSHGARISCLLPGSTVASPPASRVIAGPRAARLLSRGPR